MEDILVEKKRFMIFTMDGTDKKWWKVFIKKPFWHVFYMEAVIINDKEHIIKIMDPKNANLIKIVLDTKEYHVTHWSIFLKKYSNACVQLGKELPKIIQLKKINIDKYNLVHKAFHKIPLCTSYVCRMLHIASFALTPYQLYKYLRKHNELI